MEAGYRILGRSAYILLLWQKGALLGVMGRLADATRDLDRALELASERGELDTAGFAHSIYSQTSHYAGDATAALRHARQALETAEKMGSAAGTVVALAALGAAHLLTDEWNEAAAALEQALATARERRAGLILEPAILAYLAEAHAGRRRARPALAAAKEALAVAQRQGNRRFEVQSHLTMARVLVRARGAKAKREIDAALARALALVEETGARLYEPFIREEMAELARLTGHEEARRREVREAHRIFTKMGAAGHAARLAAELQE